MALRVGCGLVGGVRASLDFVGGLLLVVAGGVGRVARHLGDLFKGGNVLHLHLGGGGEGADAGLLGFDGAQAVGVEVGRDDIEGAAAVAVGGLSDGCDLHLAVIERLFGGVSVGRGLGGSRGRRVQFDLGFVEVFAGDLGVLGGGCRGRVDLGELDLDFGDAHRGGFFGRLRRCDFFLRGSRLRQLRQDQQGTGGKHRQGRADCSALSHRRLISCA